MTGLEAANIKIKSTFLQTPNHSVACSRCYGQAFIYLVAASFQKRKTCIFPARLAMIEMLICKCAMTSAARSYQQPPALKQPEVSSLLPTNSSGTAPLPFQSKGIYFLIRNYTSHPAVFIDAKPGELCFGQAVMGVRGVG